MFCNKCGKEIDSNSLYCEECNSSNPQIQKSRLEINYETFKSDVNVVFVVSIVSLALLFFGFHPFDLVAAIFCLVKHKKLVKDVDLYINMPDYVKTLSNLKYGKVMAIISLICSVISCVLLVLFVIFYVLFAIGAIVLPMIPMFFN